MIYLLIYIIGAAATGFAVLYYYRCQYERLYPNKEKFSPDFKTWLDNQLDPVPFLVISAGLIWPLAWLVMIPVFAGICLMRYSESLTEELYKYLNKKE
jgi:hypothetical protein